MNSVFRDLLRKCVLIFFDDILVFSKSWPLHLDHLSLVLDRLQAHSLYAKPSKYSFGQTKIEYLGHVVSGSGVEMDQQNKRWQLFWLGLLQLLELNLGDFLASPVITGLSY